MFKLVYIQFLRVLNFVVMGSFVNIAKIYTNTVCYMFPYSL